MLFVSVRDPKPKGSSAERTDPNKKVAAHRQAGQRRGKQGIVEKFVWFSVHRLRIVYS
jgi:hypothetical protein